MNERVTSRTRLAEKESEVRDLNHRLNALVSSFKTPYSCILIAGQNEELTKSREAAAVAQANQSHLQTRTDDLNKQLQRALEKLAVFERRPGTVGITAVDMGGSEEENLRAQVAELRQAILSLSPKTLAELVLGTALN